MAALASATVLNLLSGGGALHTICSMTMSDVTGDGAEVKFLFLFCFLCVFAFVVLSFSSSRIFNSIIHNTI